jgi:hypothetical protein
MGKRKRQADRQAGRQAGSHPSFDLCTCRPLSRLFYSSTGGGTRHRGILLFFFFFLVSFSFFPFSFLFFFSRLSLSLSLFSFFSPLCFSLRLLSYSLAVSSRSLPLSHTQAHTHTHTLTHTHTHTKDEHDAISVIITGDVTPWVAQFQNPAQELRVFDGILWSWWKANGFDLTVLLVVFFDMYYSFLSFSLIRSLLPTSIALLLQSQFTIRLHTSFLSLARSFPD